MVNGTIFRSLLEAKALAEDYQHTYNAERLHGAFDYTTPDEFYQAWDHDQKVIKVVSYHKHPETLVKFCLQKFRHGTGEFEAVHRMSQHPRNRVSSEFGIGSLAVRAARKCSAQTIPFLWAILRLDCVGVGTQLLNFVGDAIYWLGFSIQSLGLSRSK